MTVGDATRVPNRQPFQGVVAGPTQEQSPAADRFTPCAKRKGLFSRPEREWTVLYYVNGNADDEQQERDKLQGLRNAGSTAEVAVVAQFAEGRRAGKAQRLEMPRESLFRSRQDYVVRQDLGPTNMGDGATLEEFLEWGMREYPARRYMVVLAGHGAGHRGAIFDDIHNDRLTPGEIGKSVTRAQAKAEVGRIEVVMADSCLLGTAENAYELREVGGYYVASQEVINTNSIEHPRLVRGLQDAARDGSPGGREAVGIIFDTLNRGSTYTLSAIDLGKMNQVAEAVGDLASEMKESGTDLEEQILSAPGGCSEATLKPGEDPSKFAAYGQIRDLYHFADQVAQRQDRTPLAVAAERVRDAVGSAVVQNYTGDHPSLEHFHGISINLRSRNAPNAGPNYPELDLVRKTGWQG